MDLDLSLGTSPTEPLKKAFAGGSGGRPSIGLKLGFCTVEDGKDAVEIRRERESEDRRESVDPPTQLNLLHAIQHLQAFSRGIENSRR